MQQSYGQLRESHWPGAGEEREGRRAMGECGTHVSTENGRPVRMQCVSWVFVFEEGGLIRGARAASNDTRGGPCGVNEHVSATTLLSRCVHRLFTAAPRIASHCQHAP